jgi:hypothetical protein
MSQLDIRPVLFLSTAHIDPATAKLLDETPLSDWPVYGGPIPDGYLIYAHDDEQGEIPADLWACCVLAREFKCEYIRFDRDGPQIGGLTVYDWEPEEAPQTP